jgi:hypothetical protein
MMPMSISFEFTREPSGWRFGTDRQIDLTNWDIDYGRDRIKCTPTPMDFVYMAGGALILFTIAIFMLIAVINPRWLGFAKSDRPFQFRDPLPGLLLAMVQDPLRSKFQQEEATREAMRQATNEMLEFLLKDKSPEEQAKILKKIDDATRLEKEKESAAKEKLKKFGWLIAIARVLAMLPISFLGFFGSLCLVRALRYFRDYLDLSVNQGSLLVRRPKLFGGVSRRVFPLNDISAISCYALRRDRSQFPQVQWYVAIASTNSIQDCLQFVVEYIPGREVADRPSERVRHFAQTLHQMTGVPVIYPES